MEQDRPPGNEAPRSADRFEGITWARFGDALAIGLTVAAVGISYGAISQAAGFAWWQTALLAALALGGAAEFTFVGVVAAGGAPVLGVLGGLLVNSRNFAFGLNVGSYIPTGWRRWLAAHLVNDETTAFSRTAGSHQAKWHNFILMAVILAIGWVGGAVIGQWLGSMIDTDAFGLDAAFPIILFCLILPDLRRRFTACMAISGGLIAVVATPFLPLGLGTVAALLVLVPTALYLVLGRSREY